MPRKTLELIVDKATRTIQSRSLFDALLKDGLAHSEFVKYKNYSLGKERNSNSDDDITLSKYLQYLLDDKTLSFYTKSRPEEKQGDKIFYPVAKNYVTRYKWSVVKMNEEQLFWIHNGE